MFRHHFSVVICIASIFLCSATHAAIEKTVTVDASIQAEKGSATQFTVAVTFNIKAGWHTYDDVGDGSEVPTSIKLKLPEGIKTVGQWRRPIGTESLDTVGKKIYEGEVEFTRSITADASAQGQTIELTVQFQACNDKLCNRPQKKKLSVEIPKASPSNTIFAIFEAPVPLMVKGKPLNSAAKQRFPSPALFDVDGDGQTELVTGSLMGSVRVYENTNSTGKGDPVWAASKPLKDADGDSIRTSNW